MNKQPITLLFLLVLVLGISFSSCKKDDDSDNQAAIIEMRDAILAEAERVQAACDGDDNTVEIRANLSVMIDELVAMVPTRTEAEKADDIAGGWLQVWSNNPFTEINGICFDTDRIYQIILAGGYFYNISQVDAFGSTLGYFIRGEYQSGETFLPIEFTDAYFSNGPLTAGTDLVALAQSAENEEIARAQVPPTPVIGLTGQLGNIYVDDVMRIITDGGTAADPGDIYVMRRMTTIE